MAETNKNQWVTNFANAIEENSNPQEPAAGAQEDNTDKYKALETVSYKDMLSSKIQTSAAKDQALKYSSVALGASGLGSQGMAESSRTGIMNNYGRAIQEAGQQHAQNLLDIETQRQQDLETKGNESWQNAMTMLQQASNQQDLDYIKNNFYDGMSDEQKRMFDYYYASFGRDLVRPQYTSLEALNNATYENEKGNVEALGDHFNEEVKVLWHHGSAGDYQNGDVVKITNGRNETIYMKWANNGFVTTNKADYDNASANNVNSFELTRGKNKNNEYKQTNTKK